MPPPVTNSNSEVDNTRRRLFELISKLSYNEILELVEELESKIKLKIEVRNYPRKPTKIEANIIVWDSTLSKTSTHKISFKESIQNISDGGVFIETAYPFRINKRLSLIFSLPGVKDSISIKGKIVRVDHQGIGVKFNETLSD
jgi:signal recognition particle subunit SEC65